ncbi:MAG: hypothetical protein HY565_02635 [Candidatus Kerfeldbacteria bacterium]|nr:hypothetical protein [Candidatus Kerfeldbacteria bacterium]
MFWKISLCLGILLGVIVSQEVDAAVFSEDLIANGKFESGLTFWDGTNISTANLDDQYALDGQFITLGQISTTQAISQTITTASEAGQVTLSFWYRLYTSDTTTNDYIKVSFIRTDTGEEILSDTIPASDGNVTDWTKYTLDASRIAGKSITMQVAVVNDGSAFTFVDVDTIRLKAESYGELVGTVVGESGAKLRNATVTIRTAKNSTKGGSASGGKKLWTGTTNKQGKFTALLLPGKTKPYQVIIKKSDHTVTGKAAITWGKRTKKTFTFSKL